MAPPIAVSAILPLSIVPVIVISDQSETVSNDDHNPLWGKPFAGDGANRFHGRAESRVETENKWLELYPKVGDGAGPIRRRRFPDIIPSLNTPRL